MNMRNDILIISDHLVEPPTDSLAFRTVTMMAHDNLNMDVLLHTTQEMKDQYYKFLQRRGLTDFIKYLLVEEENEDGIRVDVYNNYPRTIVINSIRFENQLNLFGQIKWLSGI